MKNGMGLMGSFAQTVRDWASQRFVTVCAIVTIVLTNQTARKGNRNSFTVIMQVRVLTVSIIYCIGGIRDTVCEVLITISK